MPVDDAECSAGVSVMSFSSASFETTVASDTVPAVLNRDDLRTHEESESHSLCGVRSLVSMMYFSFNGQKRISQLQTTAFFSLKEKKQAITKKYRC
jgi:hypothetical protein